MATPAAKPKVLIAGAGIGGLVLAIILEKAQIPYEIFERSTETRLLGASHSLGVNVMPFFKQIGIFEEFTSLSKVIKTMDNYNEQRELVFTMDFEPTHHMGGGFGYVTSRPVLHDLLLRQIPSHKIHRGKKVVSIEQDESCVRIHCQDSTTYEGDILVGADGAYSSVRQSMFEKMKEGNLLPASDHGALPYSCICLVGQTRPLSSEFYPELLEPISKFSAVKAETEPFSWTSISVPGNRYCWVVTHYLDEEFGNESNDTYKSSEWGAESAESMCKEVRDFPIPGGVGPEALRTVGALIDNTPKELISKIKLEQKVFETWYHKRTVLLGDACHKIHPASGAGSLNAIMDAVSLGNWIAALQDTRVETLEKSFQEYKEERYDVVMASYNNGRMLSKVNAKANWKTRLIRFLTQNMPNWLWMIMMKRMAENRPQLWFLPQVEDTGTVPPKYQASLQKNLNLVETRESVLVV